MPASQYTNAGMIEKIVPMIMKNQRPTIACRIWSLRELQVEAPEPLDRPLLRPERLAQQHPADTESVSSVTALISASRFWVSVLTSRRTLPTR